MKIMKMGKAVLSTLTLAAVMPMVALAQVAPPSAATTGLGTYGGVVTLIKTITSWLFGILLVAAVLFLIYAAFLYLTSGGDEEKTKKAKSYVIYAIIAIAIGILAQAIVALVGSLLNYSVPTS